VDPHQDHRGLVLDQMGDLLQVVQFLEVDLVLVDLLNKQVRGQEVGVGAEVEDLLLKSKVLLQDLEAEVEVVVVPLLNNQVLGQEVGVGAEVGDLLLKSKVLGQEVGVGVEVGDLLLRNKDQGPALDQVVEVEPLPKTQALDLDLAAAAVHLPKIQALDLDLAAAVVLLPKMQALDLGLAAAAVPLLKIQILEVDLKLQDQALDLPHPKIITQGVDQIPNLLLVSQAQVLNLVLVDLLLLNKAQAPQLVCHLAMEDSSILSKN